MGLRKEREHRKVPMTNVVVTSERIDVVLSATMMADKAESLKDIFRRREVERWSMRKYQLIMVMRIKIKITTRNIAQE